MNKRSSLECKYNTKMQAFADQRLRAKALREDAAHLERRIELCDDNERRARILHQLDDIRAEVARIENGKAEIDYLLDAMPFLMQHSGVPSASAPAPARGCPAVPAEASESGTQPGPDPPTPENQRRRDASDKRFGGLLVRKKSDAGKDGRGDLYARYMATVENELSGTPAPISIEEDHSCAGCGDKVTARVICPSTATSVCTLCGDSREFMDGSMLNMTYDQEINMNVISSFCYKCVTILPTQCVWLLWCLLFDVHSTDVIPSILQAHQPP